MQLLISTTAFFAALFAPPIQATGIPDTLKVCGSGQVERVESGDRLRLEGGTMIVLSAIKAPELWPQSSGYKSWPHAWQAKQALEQMAHGQNITLYCDRKTPRQRMTGELLAQIVRTSDRLWLQAALVRSGQAYFFPNGYDSTKTTSLLRQVEQEARANKNGLWARPGMHIQPALGDSLRPGWFQLVEGTVLSSTKRQDKTYLNFGDDWRTDFTVEIPKRLYRRLGDHMTAQTPLIGRKVEVRGWVEWAGGPKIILEDAQQLVVLPTDTMENTAR